MWPAGCSDSKGVREPQIHCKGHVNPAFIGQIASYSGMKPATLDVRLAGLFGGACVNLA